ncbi:MAG TPA: nucleoside hydrolase [Acetobacteraceae bacterium]|jgi:purine nucleosidase|nr:nucleoside hydrolase [Acetobacteraceae bacterium]
MSGAVQSIIIDADPGQDDAVAMLLAFAASDRLEIRAITTVAGNVSVAQTTANALRIRDLAERPGVPVIAGMAAPMVLALETAEFVCGPDGLAGADLLEPDSSAEPGHAVAAIIRLLRAAEPGSVTLAALGPLTNVAMALRLAPDIVPAIARVVVMGGALGLGNMTPAAEFNFYVDPHAARVVLEAGIRTILFGLHATHQALVSPDHLTRLRGLSNRAGSVTHAMLTRPRPGGLGTTAHPMHDPCVIGWLLWPELFEGRDCYIHITTEGELRGRSTIDWHDRQRRPPNAFVVNAIDADTLFDRMIDALATLP